MYLSDINNTYTCFMLICSHAYLVYPDKETAHKAAISYCDPDESFVFLGKVASVVPAVEAQGGEIFVRKT